MDLIQVHVLHLQASQRIVAGLNDVFAAKAPPIRAGPHRAEHLGRDHDIIARSHLFEPLPSDFFAAADGVNIRGIEKVNPGLQRDREVLAGFMFTERPVPAHGP
jgi:hypothetical protein